MDKILLVGAGRSTASLYHYLVDYCGRSGSLLEVFSQQYPSYHHGNTAGVKLVVGDIFTDGTLEQSASDASMIISMLPASLHLDIAKFCVERGIHFLSASYVSAEMRSLDQKARDRGVLLLNECGLDPGLDHMSAMETIHQIRARGGEILSFESFAGGLVAPASDDNPWNYKLSWNPRNVILAGQGGVAKFRESGTYKYIPYQQLFKRTELIQIPNYGRFEGYANRDSLKYEALYELEGIPTIYRGTLRRPGFCKAWQKLIELGMTDDSYILEDTNTMTKRQFTNLFLAYHPTDRVELKFQRFLNIAQDDFDLMEKMEFLGLFSDEAIKIERGSPAQILQSILEDKWKLGAEDKDMIVMWHRFKYKSEEEEREMQVSLVVEGSDQYETAMAKTVGLPLGIAAKSILEGKIKLTGVQIPVKPEVYQPILSELKESFGIEFKENLQ